jgi:DNA end-binding protein Ku
LGVKVAIPPVGLQDASERYPEVMMARALWKGAISFGLVYIPVQLHAASRESSLRLHFLDKRNFSPIGYRRTNKQTGQEVGWPDTIRGYEYQKGKYVALSEADLRQANVKATSTIEIASFTKRLDIPAEFYETPYYLVPQRGGEKVYALLREALRRTQRVAVASFVMHGRQHLASIAAGERALELNTLRFAADILSVEELEVPASGAKPVGINAKELSMAERLVEEMSAPFEPRGYHDSYREDLLKRIEEKIRKGETHAPLSQADVEEPHGAKVIDLMGALRKSLERRGETPAGRAPARRALRTRRKASATAHRKRA